MSLVMTKSESNLAINTNTQWKNFSSIQLFIRTTNRSIEKKYGMLKTKTYGAAHQPLIYNLQNLFKHTEKWFWTFFDDIAFKRHRTLYILSSPFRYLINLEELQYLISVWREKTTCFSDRIKIDLIIYNGVPSFCFYSLNPKFNERVIVQKLMMQALMDVISNVNTSVDETRWVWRNYKIPILVSMLSLFAMYTCMI